jgi:hypothetical protein
MGHRAAKVVYDPLAVHWQWAMQSSSEEPGFTEPHASQTMTKGEGTGYYPEDVVI